jgi:DNA end-binding protein Ku
VLRDDVGLARSSGSASANRFFCPHCNVVVERDDLVRGFEYAKEKYATFSGEELEALEAGANRSIDLKQFVPYIEGVSPLCRE